MWSKAGLVRDGAGLREALGVVERVASGLDGLALGGGAAYNLAWQDWLNLRNMAVAARLIVSSALAREESRGAHYRGDFPEPTSGPIYSVRVRRGRRGVETWREPVALTRAEPARDARPASVEAGD
jgi:succinate dehydrogenase/fumarate reductase flavoprotein subunit